MDHRLYEPIFGSWYIEEEIGSGAEGSLYRISRTDALGNKYYSALKVVSVPASKSETASLMAGGMSLEEVSEYYKSVLGNTTQEFELLEKLKGNSNIVSYEDHDIFGHEDGIGWDILIRLEELTPLVNYSIDNPLSADEVSRMGRDICRGLSLCKKYGIVHRDIKPDNIFISPSGSYKLGDFGIARIIEQTTKGLSRKGTYEYMAPEVYWGHDYGASVDIYSLGMVMYRYLNDGRMPFMPQSPAAVHADDREEAFIKRVNGHEMPAPRCGSEELKRIVLKACKFDRADRYQSVEEMLRDLDKYVEDTQTDPAAATATPAVSVAGTSTSGKVSATSGTTAASDNPARPADYNSARPAKSRTGRGWKVLGLLAVLCGLVGYAVWASIPKEVTDIDVGSVEGGADIYIGDDLTLTCTVIPDRFKDEPVTFRPGDESIITVDDKGTVHALKTGDTTLTVTAKEYSEELEITVIPKVTAIKGIDKKISLTTGDTLTLKPELEPEEFADEPVTFKSGDKKVVKVSRSGKLTAVSAGETTLTVRSGGCKFRAKVSVTDPEPVIEYTYDYSYDSSGSSSGTSYSNSSRNSSGSSRKSSSGNSSSSSSNKSSSGSSKKSSGSSGNKGYFDSGDDEHF